MLLMVVFSFPLLVEFLHEVAAGYSYNSCTHVWTHQSKKDGHSLSLYNRERKLNRSMSKGWGSHYSQLPGNGAKFLMADIWTPQKINGESEVNSGSTFPSIHLCVVSQHYVYVYDLEEDFGGVYNMSHTLSIGVGGQSRDNTVEPVHVHQMNIHVWQSSTTPYTIVNTLHTSLYTFLYYSH